MHRKRPPISDISNLEPKAKKTKLSPPADSVSKKRKASPPVSEPKPKKRKKKKDERAYNPKNDNRKNTVGGDCSFRFDQRTTVEIDGKTVPYKVAMIVGNNIITKKGVLLTDIQKNVYAKLPHFRPIDKVEYDKNGSPITIETPQGSKLFKRKNLKVVKFFDNYESEANASQIKHQLDAKHEFYQSKQYQQIKNFVDSFKAQQVEITPALYKATDSERRKNNFERDSSQNEQLAKSGKAKEGSATAYVQETELFVEGMKWEWLHLIPHEVWGKASQDMQNLVAGTEYANTDMILVESQLRSLSKRYPEGFTLKVKAHLVEKINSATQEHLQLGTLLDYDIITKDFTIPFKFNLQTEDQAHKTYQDGMKAFFQTIDELTTDTNPTPTQPTPSFGKK